MVLQQQHLSVREGGGGYMTTGEREVDWDREDMTGG